MLIPNVVSCGAASSALEKGEQWEGALPLLQQMRRELVKGSSVGGGGAASSEEDP